MSVLKANCPSCAGPIEFKAGSTIVVVCPFCRSAVSRTDRKLEDLGKVAEVVQSKSPLKVGLKGVYDGKRFELTGRAQIKHGAGGFWDEWYATFNNGWTGWLAEAQGRFYMTFYRPLPKGVTVPGYDELTPGQKLTDIVPDTPLVVQEKGNASYISAEGEIPYELDPSEKTNYVDLAGKNKVFATIDYGTNPPFVFYGKEVTLEDIGLAKKKSAERAAPRVAAEAMGCPKCGGTLELKAPDKTERVTCPYCESLLDVNEGNLKFLRALKPSPSPTGFAIDIGAKGTFPNYAEGKELEVIGAMTRSVVFDGIKYFWNEYLLYNPRVGFKWLVQSDDHWSFVESVNPAEVDISNYSGVKPTAKFNGKTFRIFQDSPANVEYVKGEFYWRVEVGDSVRAADFVSPPYMLSQELTNDEVTWSLGTYVPKKEIEKVFDLDRLPGPRTVAPNQPFPSGNLIKYGFLLLGALILVSIFMLPVTGIVSTPLNQEFVLDPLSGPSTSRIVFSQTFELKSNSNVQISGRAPSVRNSWTELSIDLVNQKNNEIEAVTIPIEYYFGVTDGESWSEGGPDSDATISAVPGGEYRLRIEGSWKDWQRPMPVSVKVEQNVTRGVNFVIAFVLLALVPVLTLFRKFSFESRRWSESMFGS